jgi:hypothetical protein
VGTRSKYKQHDCSRSHVLALANGGGVARSSSCDPGKARGSRYPRASFARGARTILRGKSCVGDSTNPLRLYQLARCSSGILVWPGSLYGMGSSATLLTSLHSMSNAKARRANPFPRSLGSTAIWSKDTVDRPDGDSTTFTPSRSVSEACFHFSSNSSMNSSGVTSPGCVVDLPGDLRPS